MKRWVKTKDKLPKGFSEDQEYHFNKGYWFFSYPFKSLDEERAIWNEHKDMLVRKWVVEQPGTRPAAWWKFDAPERRRRIDGKVHPFDDQERIERIRRDEAKYPKADHSRKRALSFGIPATIAHLDHVPENSDPDNLRAWCQRCHLRYDRHHHAETRRRTIAVK